MERIKTISILGPTASGKSGLAVALSKEIGGEVVSCDSMQLYRGMDIGTATPGQAEQDGVPHHLLSVIGPDREFSAADYARLASDAIGDIASRGNIPVLCGGTGLYYDALMSVSAFGEGEPDEELRNSLYRFAEEKGADALHERLRSIDPEAAEQIHPNNVKRVVRAIEVYETTGKTKTETDREQISGEIPYDDTAFILLFSDREMLYDRINRRVEQMFADGLEEEVRSLFSAEKSLSRTAAQAIGYKEFLPYFRGDCGLDDVMEAIKLSTRHYAKRQMIWFRRYTDKHILVPDRDGAIRSVGELVSEILEVLKNEE